MIAIGLPYAAQSLAVSTHIAVLAAFVATNSQQALYLHVLKLTIHLEQPVVVRGFVLSRLLHAGFAVSVKGSDPLLLYSGGYKGIAIGIVGLLQLLLLLEVSFGLGYPTLDL